MLPMNQCYMRGVHTIRCRPVQQVTYADSGICRNSRYERRIMNG